MLKLLRYLKRREWLMVLGSVIFIVGQVWLDLKLPEYMSEITRLVQSPNGTTQEIWHQGLFMLACALGSAAMSVIVGFFAAFVAASLSKRVREAVFDKVQSFSMQEIQKFSTASLITRSTNDITQIQMIVAMGLQVIVKAPILAVWAIFKIIGKSYQWSLATAVAILVLMIIISAVLIFVIPKFKRMQTLTDRLNNVTRENLSGIRVVRAYNAEQYEEEKFEKANEDLTKTSLFTHRFMAIFSPAMNLIMGGLNLSIYWIGAYLINQALLFDKLTVFSDMVVFSSYAMQIVVAFVMMTMTFIMLPRAAVSGKRINEVLNMPLSIVDGQATVNNQKGDIEFKNVCFRYPGADECVLQNINLHIHKGDTVAFIGSTGSGKSTLINLVPRFYDVSEGELLVDGINVKDYKLFDLHSKIGYISQNPVLFSGTVAENLQFGQTVTGKPSAEAVVQALEISQSKSFIEKLTEQQGASVSEGGTNFSGGQKQRLSIARAIARQPEIFIFDDSFSALDYKTDRNLRKALKKHQGDITTLIVAQRIGTIKDADMIVVLEQGQTVGMGTHKDLLKSCKVYQEIAYSQLSKEELEHE